jgi:hypothetical protein
MKHMTWAIVVIGLLLAGSTLPAEAAGGGGGFHGGGGGYHGGGGGYHGGGYHGGGYGGTGVYIGGGLGWWGPSYPYYPYPYYSYPYYSAPPVVVQSAPTEYIQQAPAAPQQTYWYYCQNARAYYPYVKECPSGWMQVVPQPVQPGP